MRDTHVGQVVSAPRGGQTAGVARAVGTDVGVESGSGRGAAVGGFVRIVRRTALVDAAPVSRGNGGARRHESRRAAGSSV